MPVTLALALALAIPITVLLTLYHNYNTILILSLPLTLALWEVRSARRARMEATVLRTRVNALERDIEDTA